MQAFLRKNDRTTARTRQEGPQRAADGVRIQTIMGQVARWDRIFLCVFDLLKHTVLYVCFELFLLPDYFLSRLSSVPLQVSGGSLTGPRYPDARQCADRYGVILMRQDKKPYRE